MNTENKKAYDQHEVIVINSDEEPEKKKKRRHHKNKCEHKRKKKLDHEKKENLKISQKVEMNNDEFSCVINVNGRISNIKNCEGKNSHRRHCKNSHENQQSKVGSIKHYKSCIHVIKTTKDKIVPSCLRRHCVGLIGSKERDCQEKSQRKKILTRVLKSSGRKYKEQRMISKYNNRKDRYSKNLPYKFGMLSPISSSSLKDDIEDDTDRSVISYDDVSLDSLLFTSGKLDRLIMRTKERDRKIQEKLTSLRQSTKQLTAHNVSEGENPIISSDTTDISIHSMATVILEPKQDDTRYLSLNNYRDFPDNDCTDKTKYKPYVNKYSNERPKIKSMTFKYEEYPIESMIEAKTYRTDSNIEPNVYSTNCFKQVNNQFGSQNKHVNSYHDTSAKSEYTYSAYTPNYPQSECNYPEICSVLPEKIPNIAYNYDLQSHYYPGSCNNKIETNSYYTTNFSDIGNTSYKSENCTVSSNTVSCLIDSTNNNHYNAYNSLNNYPVELQRAPLSGAVGYDTSTILPQLKENNEPHLLYNYNSIKIEPQIINNKQNNSSYYPVKLESSKENNYQNVPMKIDSQLSESYQNNCPYFPVKVESQSTENNYQNVPMKIDSELSESYKNNCPCIPVKVESQSSVNNDQNVPMTIDSQLSESYQNNCPRFPVKVESQSTENNYQNVPMKIDSELSESYQNNCPRFPVKVESQSTENNCPH